MLIYLKNGDSGMKFRSEQMPRRPDIDIMNIFMTWLILLFHVGCIYNHGIWYVKDHDIPLGSVPDPASLSFYADLFTSFMNAWNMPLFFFMAGVSSWLALNR